MSLFGGGSNPLSSVSNAITKPFQQVQKTATSAWNSGQVQRGPFGTAQQWKTNPVGTAAKDVVLGMTAPIAFGMTNNRFRETMPGSNYDPVFGGQAAQKEKEAYRDEQRSQQNTLNEQNSLIQQNRAQYASPQLQALRQQFVDANRLSGMQQAGTAFGGQLTQNRIRSAQSGNIGGSQDIGGQNEALGNYYAQMAQAASGAANMGQAFDQQLQQQRLAQEQQIRGSQIADLSGQRVDLASLLNQANMGTMTTNALGSALPQLASGAQNYAIARQYGA